MTRKKSRLWLNRPRRSRNKSNREQPVDKAPTQLSSKETIEHEKEHSIPSRGSSPKRRKMSIPESDTQNHLLFSSIQSQTQSPLVSTHQIPQTYDDTSDDNADFILFKSVMQILKQAGVSKDFKTFMELVNENRFPLDNISFLLFLETSRFLGLTSTSTMRYSDTTKRFWKTGYRLFHAKFIYFMSGPKNIGDVTSGEAESGSLKPDPSKINFAIPSQRIITEYSIGEVEIPRPIKPGIMTPVLESLSSQPSQNQYMLCADGKKVTSGIDTKGGDVDMFGFENGIPLFQQKDILYKEIRYLKDLTAKLSSFQNKEDLLITDNTEKNVLCTELCDVVSMIGNRIKDCRELAFRQRLGLGKFMNMAGEKWRDSRYVYVISGLQASLYQLKEFMNDALSNTESFLEFISCIQFSVSRFVTNDVVDDSRQSNMLKLYEETDPQAEDEDKSYEVEPRYIKQRSDIWHMLRQKARVTGSTMHSAIGLRGLKEQKAHFSKFFENFEEQVSDETRERMNYGNVHEKDAIATLIGKVMPAYFPKQCFVEEGCYVIPGKSSDILGVVSPDGSIRNTSVNENKVEVLDVVAAVEAKCPYPSDKRLGLHYAIPEYYVIQCLAEMAVLNTNLLIYISYSEESTTFLKVEFCKDLWDVTWNEVIEIYDVDIPSRPKKVSSNVKEIRQKIREFAEKNVHFLCEVPSAHMNDSGSGKTERFLNFCYSIERPIRNDIMIHKILYNIESVISKAIHVVENGYNLMRRRATEVMVWVITNKHRNSSLEVPCSLPVAYGLKDYRLSSTAMRNATEYVLQNCKESGLEILTLSADGQWITLMNRDSSGKPLTIYQLQKDEWRMTQKLTKQELVRKISEINTASRDHPLYHVTIHKKSDGSYEMLNKDSAACFIATNLDSELWKQGRKSTDEAQISHEDKDGTGNIETVWLPESIIEKLPENTDTILQEAISVVSNEVMGVDLIEPETGQEKDQANDQENEQSVIDIAGTSDTTLTQNTETETNESDTMITEHDTVTENEDTALFILRLTPLVLTDLLDKLRNDPKTAIKWQTKDTTFLQVSMSSEKAVKGLTHLDLNSIYDCIKDTIPTNKQLLRKSWNKEKKVNFMCGILGHKTLNIETFIAHKKNKKTIPTLKNLAKRVIQGKSYPKVVLRSAYAAYDFQTKLKQWQDESPFESPTFIDGLDKSVPYWFSYPERNQSTGRLLGKSVDFSHNLTHLRVRTSTTNICGTSPKAWKECAKSGQTSLSIPLVEDLIDKQSVPNARTHFSVEVEEWMKCHGFKNEANFTNLVRNWYEASDSPGMASLQRVNCLSQMRDFLLENIHFYRFPPNTRYFKGIPCVTYEGMLMDIDTKLQLHAMTSTYNIRSVGSLAAETTVGILQSMYPTTNVSIKAKDVPSLITNVVEVMTCKAYPNRGFIMKTSRTSGVYPDHEAENVDQTNLYVLTNQPDNIGDTIYPRDNAFDLPERNTSRRGIKFGKISGPQAPSRGALPVRQFHRKDESKILPTKRLNIEMDS